jgi:hypothetical protein
MGIRNLVTKKGFSGNGYAYLNEARKLTTKSGSIKVHEVFQKGWDIAL